MSIPQTAVTDAAAAFPGLIADVSQSEILSYINLEDNGEVPFGFMVSQDDGGDPNAVMLPDAQADCTRVTLVGIVAHSHAYAKDSELGDLGLKVGTTLNVMRKGRIWVYCNEASGVQMGDAVRVMASNTVGDEGDLDGPGSFWGDTANGGDTVVLATGARWMSTTTGPGLALLEFDLNAVTVTND